MTTFFSRVLFFAVVLTLLFVPVGSFAAGRWVNQSSACVLFAGAPEAALTRNIIEGVKDLRLVSQQGGQTLVDQRFLDPLYLSDFVGDSMTGGKLPNVKLQLVLNENSSTRIPLKKKLLFTFWLDGTYCESWAGCSPIRGQWKHFRYLDFPSDQFIPPMVDEEGNLTVDLPLSKEKIIKQLWDQRCNLKYAIAGFMIEGFELDPTIQRPQPFFRVIRKGNIGGSRKDGGAWPQSMTCQQDPRVKKK